MNCADTSELICAFADDELDVAMVRQIEQHLHDCPSCRQALDRTRSIKAAAGQAALFYPAPVDLRARILAAAGQADRLTIARRRGPAFWVPLGLAASIALMALGYFAFVDQSAPGQFAVDAQEILDAHIRSLQSPEPSHLYDVQSTDQHTVKPWFDQHVDFSPPVRQLEDEGFPLLGGRLDYIHGHPVAAMVYRRAKHTINLFVWPGESAPGTMEQRGFHFIRWNARGMTFWAVSDLNEQELGRFAALVRESPPAATAPASF